MMGAGCTLGYRRIATGGSWIVHFRDETGHRPYEALGSLMTRAPDGITAVHLCSGAKQGAGVFRRRVREIAGDVIHSSGALQSR